MTNPREIFRFAIGTGCCPAAECVPAESCRFQDSIPTEAVVDLGAGGWVDDQCNKCDELAGEWTLPQLVDEIGPLACTWGIEYDAWCDLYSRLTITFSILSYAEEGKWRARVVLTLKAPQAHQDYGLRRVWDSEVYEDTPNCRDGGAGGIMTLGLTGGYTGIHQDQCDVSTDLPTTIQVWWP